MSDTLTLGQLPGPVQRVQLPNGVPVWLVTRHAEVLAALNDPRLSNRDQDDWFDQGTLRPEVKAAMNSHMLRIDPPDHTRMRKLAAKAFVPRRVEALRPRIERFTSELLDRLAAHGRKADIVAEYAAPLPVWVMCEMLGVPVADRENYRAWADAFIAGIGAADFPAREVTEFVAHLRELVAHRRAEPDDGLLSALITARDENDRLSEDELISTVFLFIVAGHETTTNLIGNGIYTLLRDPELAGRVRTDPAELGPAIEEILRYEGPVTAAAPRIATCALDLFGARIAAGDLIVLSLHAANHDDSVFTAPEMFRIGRERNPHLSFAHGIHFCMGAPLARLEAELAIGGFLGRFPHARLATAPESLRWRESMLTHGLAELPVILD